MFSTQVTVLVLFPLSSLSSHFFFLLNILFQTGHDACPLASSHQRGGITHFFVFFVTFPLYIYLRIKFTFLYDITEFSFVIPPNLQIQLWLVLQNSRFFHL